MSTIDIADRELLTPGSVWLGKKNQPGRFLFVANTNVPEDARKDFPEVAIYADASNNLFSVPLDRFVGRRSFHNIDPVLEAKVNDLLNGDDDEISLDDDELTVDDAADSTGNEQSFEVNTGDAGPAVAGAGLTLAGEESEAPRITFMAESDLPQSISAEVLNLNVAGYTQTPQGSNITHTLLFLFSEDLDVPKLRACFSPSTSDTWATFATMIDHGDEVLPVKWDTFLGVYTCIYYNQAMLQVVFQTSDVIDQATDDQQFAVGVDAQGQQVIAVADVAQPIAEPAVEGLPDALGGNAGDHVIVSHIDGVAQQQQA